MKNLRIHSMLLFAMLFSFASLTSCDDDGDDINVIPGVVLTLTEDEKVNLQFMREEEKLARDVYLYMFEKHGLNVFENIAASEQSHMNAILKIMEKYDVEDPASTETGVFTNAVLQQLYDDLIAQGDISLVAALTVGATIEDLDIRDLDNVTATTTKADLIEMYDILNCGSRNHMRAFTGKLNEQGETYVPQFITQEKFDEVINGEHERCGQ